MTFSAAMSEPSSIQAAARFSLSTNPIAAPIVTLSAGICGSVTPPSGSKVRPAIVKLRSRSRRKSLSASSAALGPGWASAEPNARVRLAVSVAAGLDEQVAERVDRAGDLRLGRLLVEADRDRHAEAGEAAVHEAVGDRDGGDVAGGVGVERDVAGGDVGARLHRGAGEPARLAERDGEAGDGAGGVDHGEHVERVGRVRLDRDVARGER